MIAILIRHGQTEWNTQNIYRGRLDIPLNKVGIKQAKAIREKLKNVHLAAVYTSPLSRAKKTAEIIASVHKINVITVNDFTDRAFGIWQGMPREEIMRCYPDIFSKWENQPHKAAIQDAESFSNVQNRLVKSLKSLYIKHSEEIVLIVSHGLTNKIMLCSVLGLDNSHFWRVKQDNGAINIFKYTLDGSKIISLNDTSHIYSINEVLHNFNNTVNPVGHNIALDC